MSKPVLWLLPFLCLLLMAGVGRADMDAASAFQQGQAAAAGGATATGSINSGGASGNVPGYTTSPSESGLYGDGRQDLSSTGMGKQVGCSTADTSGFGGKECDAINFLGGGRPDRPLESNDVLFNASKSVTKDNRSTLAGLSGGTATGGCTMVETTIPGLDTIEHCEEWLEPTENRCPVGRVVKVDADANYQCDETVSAHETLTCKRKAAVSVVKAVDGTTGKIILATIKPGAYLYKDSTKDGLWVHGLNGADLPVPSNYSTAGDAVGLTYYTDYAGEKRLDVTHNGCTGDVCSGSFAYNHLRPGISWWSLVTGTFNQNTKNVMVCPQVFPVTERWNSVYGYSGSASITAACPAANGAVTVTASRVNGGYCGGNASITATLAPGQSADLSITAQRCSFYWGEDGSGQTCSSITCPASITYNGSGSFSYNYWAHYDMSSDSRGWFATGLAIPVARDAINYSTTNECALLESRAK
jgi:hypothetical protein